MTHEQPGSSHCDSLPGILVAKQPQLGLRQLATPLKGSATGPERRPVFNVVVSGHQCALVWRMRLRPASAFQQQRSTVLQVCGTLQHLCVATHRALLLEVLQPARVTTAYMPNAILLSTAAITPSQSAERHHAGSLLKVGRRQSASCRTHSSAG